MSDTLLDGSGEQVPGRRPLEGTDLEIAYNLLGDDLVLRVNKAGVQVFGVVLENAAKTMTAERLLGLKTEKSDLVVRLGTRAEAVANIGYQLGRVANRLIKLPVKRWKRLSGSRGSQSARDMAVYTHACCGGNGRREGAKFANSRQPRPWRSGIRRSLKGLQKRCGGLPHQRGNEEDGLFHCLNVWTWNEVRCSRFGL